LPRVLAERQAASDEAVAMVERHGDRAEDVDYAQSDWSWSALTLPTDGAGMRSSEM